MAEAASDAFANDRGAAADVTDLSHMKMEMQRSGCYTEEELRMVDRQMDLCRSEGMRQAMAGNAKLKHRIALMQHFVDEYDLPGKYPHLLKALQTQDVQLRAQLDRLVEQEQARLSHIDLRVPTGVGGLAGAAGAYTPGAEGLEPAGMGDAE